jgi:hypothetical protein
LRSKESRDSFHFQIEHLKTVCGMLQTELSHTIASRDGFQSKVEHLDAELVCIVAARDDLAATVAQIQTARDEAMTELGATMRANAELEREMSGLQASRSWRFTRPLRTLATALRRWSRPRQ